MKGFKVKNTSERAFLHNQLLLALIEPEVINESPDSHSPAELDACDEEIKECQGMLQYYLATGDSVEARNWKSYLQAAKTRKRMIRKMIDEHTSERSLLAT